jgi:transaldolase
MKTLAELPIKIFADGADQQGIFDLYRNPLIRGMTTNPSLMRKAGIVDYEKFAREILEVVRTKPISFEVLSDDFAEMHRQALKISKWQENVFVKIPITNTRGESSVPLIRELAASAVRVNVTAILTLEQVTRVVPSLHPAVPAVVSIFAGRVADTGIDPMPVMSKSLEMLKPLPQAELLWGSVREVLNIFQAAESGAHIVTVTHDILAKAQKLAGMDLGELSVETVRMFFNDAAAAGYTL